MIHTEVQRDRAIPEEDEGERLRIAPDESFEMSRRKVKLVIQVAKKCRGMGATFPDLFQRGNHQKDRFRQLFSYYLGFSEVRQGA